MWGIGADASGDGAKPLPTAGIRHNMEVMSNAPIGPRYLHGHHDAVLRSHRYRTAHNSAAYLLPRLTPDARVLDVGCGPGTITVDLARLAPDGEVTGLDAANEVLDEARAGAAQAEVTNISFESGDVYRLRFDDASFDVVHAHQVLQHLQDPVKALAEMRRVCRPGGVVAARDADYAAMCWSPPSAPLTAWRSLYDRVARSAGGEPNAGRQLLAWARAAGFSQIDASGSVWSYTTEEERDWWGGLWAERVIATRFAEQALGDGLATRTELERLSDGWKQWAAADDACFYVLHGEVLCTP